MSTRWWEMLVTRFWDVLGNGLQSRAHLAAAEQAGLRDISQDISGVHGTYGDEDAPLAVSIVMRSRDESTRLHIEVVARISVKVRGALSGSGGFVTGDEGFDRNFRVEGNETLATAVLDEQGRDAVRWMLSAAEGPPSALGARIMAPVSGAIDDGEVTVDFPAGHSGDPMLPEAIAHTLAMAQRLLHPLDLAARLAQSARRDRTEAVRRFSLLALQREYSGHALARETLLAALADPGETVRLEAALALGAEGMAALRGLAASVGDEECGARALQALDQKLEVAEVLRFLEEHRRARRLKAATACVEVLGGRGGAGAVEALRRVLAEEAGPLARAAAAALGQGQRAGAEAALLEVGLPHAKESVRMASAQALGRVGSAAAVLALEEAAEREAGAPRRAAQQAVVEIQARLVGAAAGQLSVASESGGALSIAPEGGQVTLTDPRKKD